MITTKVTGFENISRQLKDAQEALALLERELGTVNFDPHDPSSIDAAVQQIEQTVDDRLGAYADNPTIGPLIDGLKEKYRDGIIDSATMARLERDSEQ